MNGLSSDDILAFDIETIPDVQGIRTMRQLPDDMSDTDVVQWIQQQRRSEVGHDFMPLYLHQVVAISGCFRYRDKLHIGSIGTPQDSEKSLIQGFFDLFKQYQLQLVSWNGNGFDLPVLQHRALIHGIVAKNYWDTGVFDSQFKWNNYINRYHFRHYDLMDILAKYQVNAHAPLDNMAKLCGFPGKLDIDGSQVWSIYQQGNIEEIRNYCELDAVNTYLLFLRFQLLRGIIIEEEYYHEIKFLKAYLSSQSSKHFLDFLSHFST